jgi:hypothetical protein
MRKARSLQLNFSRRNAITQGVAPKAIAQNTLDQSMPKDLAWLLYRKEDAIFA